MGKLRGSGCRFGGVGLQTMPRNCRPNNCFVCVPNTLLKPFLPAVFTETALGFQPYIRTVCFGGDHWAY